VENLATPVIAFLFCLLRPISAQIAIIVRTNFSNFRVFYQRSHSDLSHFHHRYGESLIAAAHHRR